MLLKCWKITANWLVQGYLLFCRGRLKTFHVVRQSMVCPSVKLHPQESQENLIGKQNELDRLQRKHSSLRMVPLLIICAFSQLATNVDIEFEKQKAQREAIHQPELGQSEICESRWRVEHILSDLYGSSSNHLDSRFSISMDSTTYESRL